MWTTKSDGTHLVSDNQKSAVEMDKYRAFPTVTSVPFGSEDGSLDWVVFDRLVCDVFSIKIGEFGCHGERRKPAITNGLLVKRLLLRWTRDNGSWFINYSFLD